MTMPRCAICHNRYDAVRIPYSLHPCSHGLCKLCVEEYITVRGSTSCPTCRGVIINHAVNYDLKEICTNSFDSSWKEILMETLCEKTDLTITISDDIMPVAGLIRKRITNDRNIHQELVHLVRNMDEDDVYSWLDVLRFPADWYVDRKVGLLLRQHKFLSKYEAGWLLEYF